MHKPLLRLAGIGFIGLGLASASLELFTSQGVGDLDYSVDVKDTIMTVAYKAYGNEDAADGKYWLARMVMNNDGDAPLTDVAVSYRIPEFVDWTTPETVPEILPGQTRVLPIYPKLPTRVTNIRSRTPASIEFKLSWHDGEREREKVETRQIEFRGVTEIEYTSMHQDELLSWYDMFDNAELCAAFITDEDPVVRQYMGEISETMGGFPICSNAEEMLKVMRSIYDYQVGTGLKYTGNKGVPEQLGDTFAIVQSVRLPRDVIYQNSGLCIELAMLWAALGQGAGAKVYLALVPGHCYPVLEANDGSIIAIESTGVGGSNLGGVASFDAAVEAGIKQFNELIEGRSAGVLVDVALHQGRGIRPPEFEQVNLADLARLLDERTQQALQAAATEASYSTETPQNPPQQLPAGDWRQYQVAGANVSIPYPASYFPAGQELAEIQPYLPALQFMAGDAAGLNTFEVYAAAQQSPEDLIGSALNFARQAGASLRFGNVEAIQFGGQPGALYPFTLSVPGETTSGGFYVYSTNQGSVGFAVGSPDASWKTIGAQIAGAVRFGQ